MRFFILSLFLVGVGCFASATPSNSLFDRELRVERPLERGRTETTTTPLLPNLSTDLSLDLSATAL